MMANNTLYALGLITIFVVILLIPGSMMIKNVLELEKANRYSEDED